MAFETEDTAVERGAAPETEGRFIPDGNQLPAASLFERFGKLIRHSVCSSTRTPGIGEYMYPGEPDFPDEINGFLIFLLCFPRKTGNEGGSDRDVGHMFPHIFQRFSN